MKSPLRLLWAMLIAAGTSAHGSAQEKAFTIPTVDLNDQIERQVVVDQEKGQYLGHPTTLLLEDGKTILCVYPKGHGRGAILYKKCTDGGRTWSERLPTPKNWETSLETPTLHRVVDAGGKKRLILFSGLYPVRMAMSEDDGESFSELKPVGEWGGIVTMASVIELKTGPGHYMALFHDDSRFFAKGGKASGVFTVYQTRSTDGGITWSAPDAIFQSADVHLCEPGAFRSPDGKQIAVLLRENRRVKNSHIIFSDDEGKTWTKPRETAASLNGDRHTAKYGPDGRLFISFRDGPCKGKPSPTEGDWVGWVGAYDDLVTNREGQYRVRLKKNHKSWDCAYPGVELLPDGTFVVTTYGHWTPQESPYILSVRFTFKELDALAKRVKADVKGDQSPCVPAAVRKHEWKALSPLPDKEGFAGSFAGTSNGALLVAGGANFPDKRPWEGGKKVWYDAIFALDRPDGEWKVTGKLPRPLGYGVSVTHRDGVVCVGGSDNDRHFADAFRLEWKAGKVVISHLAPLPRRMANACGALVGDTLYVAGGQETPDATETSKTVWKIDLAEAEPRWEEIEGCPGGGRMLAVAGSFDGAFWLVGGVDLVSTAAKKIERRYLKDAYRYDPGRGWTRVADLHYPLAAAPTPAPTDASGFYLLGGDDGSKIGLTRLDHHPGFTRKVLKFDRATANWAEAGELPCARVTVPLVEWNKLWVIPSGEIRPGVRSPEVWSLTPGTRE